MDRQQIKARFFGAHIGCGVEYSNGMGTGHYISAGVFMDGDNQWKLRMDDCGAVRLDACKLILRPPTALKEHELAQLDAIGMKYRREKQLCGVLKFDYLRSINICVPFMGLDPISEGWAILEKIPANAPQTKKEEES